MLIRELTLRGLLSFGPQTPPIELQPLNVLIGPNGSGKSNLIEAIGLLRSAPDKLSSPMRGPGGGPREWIWKGNRDGSASVEAIIERPESGQPLRHVIEFTESASRLDLIDERIENQAPEQGHQDVRFYYRFQNGRPVINVKDGPRRQLQRQDVAPDESILSQRQDPDQFPELAYLARNYDQVRLYREWSFGRSSVFRNPQPADDRNDLLLEDFSNLGLFLNRLRGEPKTKKKIIERLRDLYDGLDDFDVRIQNGWVDVFLTEGEFTIPASRLSDGTMRYLCLLAILLAPDPPALVCIEEPELGLHPDLLPKIADLFIEASERMQVIATTHSDILVDALTERPESVLVVEKHRGESQVRRLEATAELSVFLEEYRLGKLWNRGDIGGTRW